MGKGIKCKRCGVKLEVVRVGREDRWFCPKGCFEIQAQETIYHEKIFSSERDNLMRHNPEQAEQI